MEYKLEKKTFASNNQFVFMLKYIIWKNLLCEIINRKVQRTEKNLKELHMIFINLKII